ncbi:hypothetical protein B0H10DRAFT_2222967 [Mycena sp. CBHHK59/15]|nr:hypothetical protein B0H10DRAFT_2222967 [Mycena sp. CBHHK59/15]
MQFAASHLLRVITAISGLSMVILVSGSPIIAHEVTDPASSIDLSLAKHACSAQGHTLELRDFFFFNYEDDDE